MTFISALAKRFQLGVAILLVGLLVLMAHPAVAATYTVKMGSDRSELKFVPDSLTISAGDTVEWVNNKVFPHNVVFDKVPGNDKAVAAKLSHKRLMSRPKQSVSSVFEVPGEYSYFCTPHRSAGMKGSITVE